MSVLAPWFLLGGMAVGLPILFHMLRRTPRGTLPFSSLMFLEPSPPRITRRSRIEHWLLLLLRSLVVAGLAVAFARPFLRDDVALPTGRGPGRLVALLVDTSASMRREGLWAELQARLRDRLAAIGPEDRVALFSFADTVATHVSFEQGRAIDAAELQRLVRAEVDELEPGWGGSALGAAVIDVAERLHAEQEERVPRPAAELWLASDLQAGADTGPLQGADWPAGIVARLVDVAPRRPTNAGLQLVEPRADAGDDTLRVRVTNAADSTTDTFTIAPQAADAAAGADAATEPLTVHVPAGESRIVAVPELPGGAAVERIVLDGDGEPFDNTLWIAPQPVVPRTVLYAGGDRADDRDGPRFFLEKVFSGSGRQPVALVPLADAGDDWTRAEAMPPALVVVTAAMPAADMARIEASVRAGGRVLLAAESAAVLEELLAAWRDAPLTVTEAEVPRYALLGEIDFRHPFFAAFADARFSDFRSIHFWRHRQVTVPEGSPWRVVARFDGGAPAILELPVGQGSVIVMTSGWRPADSQLARSSKFAPLLFQMLDRGAADAARPLASIVGRPLPLPHPEAAGTLTTPSGASIAVAAGQRELPAATEPGIHVLRRDDMAERLAVNVPPEESRTTAIAADQLADLGMPLEAQESAAVIAAKAERLRQSKAIDLERRQQFWRWFVAAALGLVIGETLLASRYQSRGGADVATGGES
ncbi:MAG: DUF4350 domain-containing protein [Pirellulales bacterium]